ncbi:MAG: flagellar filament capping protein FliD [Planctomycetes bacterium]|nr:flagellar filament capping protein FliD [Planctomycetota bacterium]
MGTQTVAITTGDSQGGGDAQVNTITVDNVANAVSYQLYFSLDPDFSNSGLALAGGTPIADSSGGAGTGTTNLVHSDAGDGGSFTPGTPLTTATQGYTIDFDTGTVKFNDTQAEAVTLTYQHGGLIFEETQTAQDAIIEFGEGANALTIKKSSNEFSDVIEGVTISLKKVDTDTPVIINVKRDIFGIKTGVQNCVNALNETNAFIAEQTFFNVDTETTGLLFSDSNLFNIRSRVSSILGTSVGSVTPGNIRSLGEIGIRISAETGTFLLDNQVLSKALSDDPDQVRDLLAELGRAEDPDIKVTTFGDNAVTSSALGYAVNITQAAERAEVEGNVDVSAGIIANETLIISREGTSVTISLTIGQTAQEAVSAINSDLLNLGISNVVAVLSTATGKITIRHESFGSKFSFTVQSSLAGTSGTGLGATVADGERTFTGEDVAGTINGEAATGIGQFLTGDTGNSTTDSLQLQVTLSAAALTSQGSGQGQVVVSRGIAAQLEVFLKFLTDETQEGPIQSAIEQANGRISDLQESIDSFTGRAQKEREKLVREFARLEQALGSLQTQSTFLEVQLNSIAAISNAIIARRPRR